MNKLSRAIILSAGLQLCGIASGQDWTVNEYGGSPCGCFTVDTGLKEITITSNPSRTLKFEVYYDDGNFTPAEINDFTIDPDITGPMMIEISGDHNLGRLWGAESIAKLNLVRNNPNGNTTRLTDFHVQHDIGSADALDFDLLDGSFEVGADLRDSVTIRGVMSGSGGLTIRRDLLGTLTIQGAANRSINVERELSGTLIIQDSLRRLLRIGNPNISGSGTLSGMVTIAGNVDAGDIDNAGQIEVLNQLSGTIDIGGDVQDGINNWVRIRQMVNGTFRCRDMDLRAQDDDPPNSNWLTTGHGTPFDATLVHSGTIDVSGVLSGRIYCRGLNDLNITVGSIDADIDGSSGYGGIMTAMGFLPNASITVLGDFTQGAIKYPASGVNPASLPMDVPITIGGDMGSPTTTARISSEACTGLDPCVRRNFEIGGVIQIGGDLYGTASGDGPAIFSDGDLTGQILIDGSLINGDANEIEIEQAMTNAAAITIDYDGWDEFDDWEGGAIIRVDGVNHAESSDSVNSLSTSPTL